MGWRPAAQQSPHGFNTPLIRPVVVERDVDIAVAGDFEVGGGGRDRVKLIGAGEQRGGTRSVERRLESRITLLQVIEVKRKYNAAPYPKAMVPRRKTRVARARRLRASPESRRNARKLCCPEFPVSRRTEATGLSGHLFVRDASAVIVTVRTVSVAIAATVNAELSSCPPSPRRKLWFAGAGPAYRSAS